MQKKNKRYDQNTKPSLKALPKITADDWYLFEEEIQEWEVKKADKKLNKGKSPGSDGLPAELYQFFFDDISNFFVAMINEIE